MSTSPLKQSVQIHKALGHPARLRILLLLRDGLVSGPKEGRWVEYGLSANPQVDAILAALPAELEKDPVIRADATLVRALRKVSLEGLCSVVLDPTRLNRPAVDNAVRRSQKMLEAAGR